MVQLSKYVQQVGMQSAGVLDTPVDASLGRAVQNLGQVGVAAGVDLQQRQEARDNFQANAALDKWKIERNADLDNAATTAMPEGGTDFTKNFVENTVKPKKDEFLASIPQSMRGRFATILDVEEAKYSAAAAKTEHAEVKRYQTNTVAVTQQQYANAINMDPEKYNELLAKGNDQIDQLTTYSPAEKAELKRGWEKVAQVAHLDRMLQDKPGEVLRMLGADSSKWSSGTKFSMLSAAVKNVETGGSANPNTAVSSAGAVGVMQVMPGTAAEIAVALGDKNFPTSGNDGQIKSYLSNPEINKIYGEYYLKKQLTAFNGDIEAAAVAYNAGPGVAKQWLESGKNDSVLPGETVAYKKKVMDQLTPDVAKIPPQDVQFVWSRQGGVPGDSNMEHVSPVLRDRLQTAFATLGIKEIRVNSGFRDEANNKRVGGADKSEHIHGNAMDIDVTNMSLDQRKDLIRSLSAAGVMGIGIYANAIHADIGARRAWGADHSGNSVPKWAQGVVGEHLAGNAIPPANKGVNPQYSSIDYETRQKYINSADNAVSKSQVNSPDMQVNRVQTRTAMMNDLASYRATGQGSEGFDETNVNTYLGADDYEKYITARETNQKIYHSTQGFGELPQETLEQKASEFEPVAGSPTFAQDLEVQKAVTQEVNRVMALRAKDPAKAAEEIPEVKALKEKAFTPKENGLPDEAAMHDYVTAVMQAQDKFNLPQNTVNADGTVVVHRAPIDKQSAMDIGRRFSAIPPVTSKNAQEVSDQIAQKYALVKKLFGDYADEVIIYSMSEYHGIDKVLAARVTAMMTQIQNGRDPFIKREAPKVEKSFMERLFGGSDEGEKVSEEEARRVARDKAVDE